MESCLAGILASAWPMLVYLRPAFLHRFNRHTSSSIHFRLRQIYMPTHPTNPPTARVSPIGQIDPRASSGIQSYLTQLVLGSGATRTKKANFGDAVIPPLVDRHLKRKWKKCQHELWQTHRWDDCRCSFVLGSKKVIPQQDILRTITESLASRPTCLQTPPR
jgi:hypothetical protein